MIASMVNEVIAYFARFEICPSDFFETIAIQVT
jgi:hypothetical protein